MPSRSSSLHRVVSFRATTTLCAHHTSSPLFSGHCFQLNALTVWSLWLYLEPTLSAPDGSKTGWFIHILHFPLCHWQLGWVHHDLFISIEQGYKFIKNLPRASLAVSCEFSTKIPAPSTPFPLHQSEAMHISKKDIVRSSHTRCIRISICAYYTKGLIAARLDLLCELKHCRPVSNTRATGSVRVLFQWIVRILYLNDPGGPWPAPKWAANMDCTHSVRLQCCLSSLTTHATCFFSFLSGEEYLL
jgi:hypothetical protein